MVSHEGRLNSQSGCQDVGLVPLFGRVLNVGLSLHNEMSLAILWVRNRPRYLRGETTLTGVTTHPFGNLMWRC